MKIKFLFLITLLTIVTLPLFAAFCHHCGKTLPDAANFCPACGTPSSESFVTAPTSTISITPTNKMDLSMSQTSLADYNTVNQLELLLTNSSYSSASRQAVELKKHHLQKMSELQNRYAEFSLYQRKLHDLHQKKYQALENYLDAWKEEERGIDRARAQAEKDKSLFILAQVNEAIETLITGGVTLGSINRIEEMERRLNRTSANFVVTAPYLLVDNQRLNRGEPIWVIDVVSASAKVLHMGKGRSSIPVCGWVSVYDLEKRSNWRSDPAFFYSEPAVIVYEPSPKPPVKIIIHGKKRYPYRHRHDDHHKGRDRRREHDYVIIKPRFW